VDGGSKARGTLIANGKQWFAGVKGGLCAVVDVGASKPRLYVSRPSLGCAGSFSSEKIIRKSSPRILFFFFSLRFGARGGGPAVGIFTEFVRLWITCVRKNRRRAATSGLQGSADIARWTTMAKKPIRGQVFRGTKPFGMEQLSQSNNPSDQLTGSKSERECLGGRLPIRGVAGPAFVERIRDAGRFATDDRFRRAGLPKAVARERRPPARAANIGPGGVEKYRRSNQIVGKAVPRN